VLIVTNNKNKNNDIVFKYQKCLLAQLFKERKTTSSSRCMASQNRNKQTTLKQQQQQEQQQEQQLSFKVSVNKNYKQKFIKA
jgi:hypothetical protein